MFKWIKGLAVNKIQKVFDEHFDDLMEKANKKIDIPNMSEEEETQHFERFKVFAKELVKALLDLWAKQ